ncbi:MAG: hypothetical protein RJA58_1378 [Pseudomonadota bacterium]
MIAAGFLMVRTQWLRRDFWEGAEKLVYFVLLPALLIAAITRSDLSSGETGVVVQITLLSMVIAAGLGILTRWIPGVSRSDWASGIQCAFRFNAYIGFAVASRAAGSEGLAITAVLLSLSVPLANFLAVFFLADSFHPIRLLKELSRNPLIIATVIGLALNLLGATPPDLIYTILDRASSASLALGLLCVGAGLNFSGITSRTSRNQSIAVTSIKLVALPMVTWLLCWSLDISGTKRDIAVLFASLPTATSAYILAARMGGNGPLAAGMVSISTLASMGTITVWYALLRAFP